MLMIFMHKRFCANIAGPLLLLLVFGTVTARAADTYWQLDPPAVGDWFDSDNWTDVVPSSSRDAHITNGGAAQIAAPGATAMNLFRLLAVWCG
ncbi:MAG: hypothetical protein ACLFVW_05720 [Phycisphaerae bacterium]